MRRLADRPTRHRRPDASGTVRYGWSMLQPDDEGWFCESCRHGGIRPPEHASWWGQHGLDCPQARAEAPQVPVEVVCERLNRTPDLLLFWRREQPLIDTEPQRLWLLGNRLIGYGGMLHVLHGERLVGPEHSGGGYQGVDWTGTRSKAILQAGGQTWTYTWAPIAALMRPAVLEQAELIEHAAREWSMYCHFGINSEGADAAGSLHSWGNAALRQVEAQVWLACRPAGGGCPG